MVPATISAHFVGDGRTCRLSLEVAESDVLHADRVLHPLHLMPELYEFSIQTWQVFMLWIHLCNLLFGAIDLALQRVLILFQSGELFFPSPQ